MINCLRFSLAHFPRNLRWVFAANSRGIHYDALFKENDVVILRNKKHPNSKIILSKPLRGGRKIENHQGSVAHEDIIGKRERDMVKTSRGVEYILQQPSLADYVTLTSRRVTPIYPSAANIIVSLLDIHPPTRSSFLLESDGDPLRSRPLNILEAGTGHGGLTIHLARALHAANGYAPDQPKAAHVQLSEDGGSRELDPNSIPPTTREPHDLSTWKSHRSGVLFTMDVIKDNLHQASKMIKGFRNGIYHDHIDFSCEDCSDFITHRMSSSSEPFLSHAVLDMPNPEDHLEKVASALRPNALIIVFNPNATQIMACVEKIRENFLGLQLNTVLELPMTAEAGREWDIRHVRPRRKLKPRGEIESPLEEQGEVEPALEEEDDTIDESISMQDNEMKIVCRPMVGERRVGGGFLGIWRKMKQLPGFEGTSIKG